MSEETALEHGLDNLRDHLRGIRSADDALPRHEEGALVAAMLAAIRACRVVEIGTHQGIMSLYICHALHEVDERGGALHTIETGSLADSTRRRLHEAGFGDVAQLHLMNSAGPEAIVLRDKLAPLDAVMVNRYAMASSSYAQFLFWSDAVRPGGLFLFHDAGSTSGDAQHHDDISLTLARIENDHPDFSILRIQASREGDMLAIAQKRAAAPAGESTPDRVSAEERSAPPLERSDLAGPVSPWDEVHPKDLQRRPWDDVRIPVRPYPITMLQKDELRYLYWLARNAVDPEGFVVDLGAWQGGSTAVLAQGVLDRAGGASARVRAYDQFIWDEYSNTFTPDSGLAPGDDMQPLFEKNVAPWAGIIEPIKVDLHNATWDPREPISLLFIDAAKTVSVLQVVWNVFGPGLRPGSIVVFQDFKHFATAFLPVLTAMLQGLKPAHVCRDGLSVGFRFEGPFEPVEFPILTPEQVNDRYNAACRALSWDPLTATALEYARISLLVQLGRIAEAQARYEQVRDWPVCAGAADAPAAIGELLARCSPRPAVPSVLLPDWLDEEAHRGQPDANTVLPRRGLQVLLAALKEADERAVRNDGGLEYYRGELHNAQDYVRSLEQRIEVAETAARKNHEDWLSSEDASRTNYERALAAEAAGREHYQKLMQTEERLREHQARLLAAEAAAASRALELSELSRVLHEELAREKSRAEFAEQRMHQLEAERNYYRRRWPPYLARRAVQKLKLRARRYTLTLTDRSAVSRFGLNARLCILFTGLPKPQETAAVRRLIDGQTRAVQRLVLPGVCEAIAGSPRVSEIQVHNWWSPDLPVLLKTFDYVLLMHPQYYGPGPLWNPAQLEMLVAALADDLTADAIVLHGGSDAPRIGAPNHVHDVDEATVRCWTETGIAALFRRTPLLEAFPPANPGESREIIPSLAGVARSGRKVLVAPQTFPTAAETALSEAAAVAVRLPAEPKAPIRGLYLTQWIECGGADKGILDLLTRLNPEVVDFSLVTTVASSHPWEKQVRGHVREIVHLGAALPLPPDRRFPAFIVEYVRRRNIGLIHIMHSILAYDALPALRAAVPGLRIIDQCHILEPANNMEGGHPAYSSRHYKRFFDRRTVTSEWLKRYLVDEHAIPDSQIDVIYTGVDWQEEFNPDRYEPGVFREKAGIPAGAKLIVFAGRLHWQKRPRLFVRIAGTVQRSRPDLDAYFALIGPGPEREALETDRQMLPQPQRVVLAGEWPHSGPVFRDADLLLMTSGHEGLAYVSYEAMAMGLPQVFTRVNGQPELITPDTGILIPPEDDDEVVAAGTRAVIELLDDEPKRRAMGAAARARVVQQFGIDRMVRQYEELYQRLR